jgi:ATP-dependent exoDNAse (exonuclease V) beta subunit
LRQLLMDFMREQLHNGENFNIFNRNIKLHANIVKQVSSLFDEKFQLVSKSFNNWFEQGGDLSKYFRAIKSAMTQIVQENKNDVAAVRDWAYQHDDRNVLKTFITPLEQFADPVAFMKKQTASKAKVPFIKKVDMGLVGSDIFGSARKDLRAMDAAALDFVNTRTYRMLERTYRYHDYKVLLDEVSTYSFIRYTNHYIEQFRKDNNIVVLADTNDLLKRVMGDDSEISFVYEKMGVNLHNFLIDEFQDTSRMQWSNLKELVYNSLGEDHDSLIIGDEKQAIYRFRNSDSSMLHSTVREEAEERQVKFKERSSDTNWRSTPEVIKFNNSFFSRMSKHLGIDGYQGVVQAVSPNKQDSHGYVRFFNAPAKAEESNEPQTDADNENGKTPEIKTQLDLLYGEISRQLTSRYRPGDIAVLVNTKKDGVKVVDYLMSKGIEVTTSEALMLNHSQSVRLIVSIMQLVVNAKDRKLSENIYDTHKRISADRTVDKIGRFEYEYTSCLQSGMNQDKAITEAIAKTFCADNDNNALSEVADIAAINPSTIYTLVDTIIEKRISPEQRIKDKAYLSAFQDAVLSYASTYGNNVVGFLQWWNNQGSKLAINAPDEIAAVTIMTIHKSKGLEFPCVHIPYASWALEGDKKKFESVWIEKHQCSKLGALDPAVVDAMPDAIRITLNSSTKLEKSIFKDIYDSNMRERIVDGFNKTYVGYTRAENELCVYFDNHKDFGTEICKVDQYEEYNQDIENPEMVEEGILPHYNADLHLNLSEYMQPDGGIIVGNPTIAKQKKAKAVEEAASREEGYISPDALIHNYPINVEGKGQSVTTVEALIGDESGRIDDEAKIKAKERYEHMLTAAERGERLHFVLSRINRLSDMDQAMRSTFFCKISDEDRATIRRMFDNPQTSDYVNRWFVDQQRALSEMNIFDPNAPETQSKVNRPDRIVWNKDGSIDIIDYKFTGDTKDEHNTQVRRYINLMRLIYPGKTINGYIWYADLTPPHIDPVQ